MAKLITWIVVLAVAAIGALAIFDGSGAGTEVIKLGIILPLSGEAAESGLIQQRALEIAADEINAAGGINGQQLALIIEDGQCDPKAGGTAAQKLVAIDQVKIIIGGGCASETLAAAEISEAAQVILISPSVADPKITAAGDFVFRTRPSDFLNGAIAANYTVNELKAQKVAVIAETSEYGQALRDSYKNSLADLGSQIVADEIFDSGAADFQDQTNKIKIAKPDVIYIAPQSTTTGLALIKELRASGLKAAIATSEILLDRQAVKDNGTLLNNVVGVEPAVDWVNNPKARALRSAYQLKYGGEAPGSWAANAYDAIHLIKEALAATMVDNQIDTFKIRDWLYATKNWPGAIGPISIDLNGDPIIGQSIKKISNGKIVDLGYYAP